MTRRRSRTDVEIPLWLLPQVLTRKVREWGDALYRISVKRTHWHQYNVTVRTRLIPKELQLVIVAMIFPGIPRGAEKRSRAGRRSCPT